MPPIPPNQQQALVERLTTACGAAHSPETRRKYYVSGPQWAAAYEGHALFHSPTRKPVTFEKVISEYANMGLDYWTSCEKPLPQRECIEVSRHGLGRVCIYEVTRDELDAMERVGSNVGLDFNVALFSLGVSLSFFATLLNSGFDSRTTFDIFVVSAALFLIFGIRWFLNRGEFSRLIRGIRNRRVAPTGPLQGRAEAPSEMEET